jgi:hypothetical protein
MALARKSTARKSPTNRGRPGKSSPVPAKKTAGGAPAVSSMKEAQASRKRSRPAGSGRSAAAHGRTDSIFAAQLEAMSKELQTIPGLRDDIQVLRLRIEELTERIDELLKRPTASDEPRADETQAPPSPESEPETATWEVEDADVL